MPEEEQPKKPIYRTEKEWDELYFGRGKGTDEELMTAKEYLRKKRLEKMKSMVGETAGIMGRIGKAVSRNFGQIEGFTKEEQSKSKKKRTE